ncbi:hypothetical protein [Nocardia jiangxiensis]|uniref:hypothetical protein n=1 Tax=Nocardia jiangxiensis TaxID=282685 RepID=UPI0002E1CB18|nr:hypothetical protein [Nocardia jiangxiensis]
MSIQHTHAYVSVGSFGKASAEYRRTQYNEQIVVVRFGGDVSVHMPYSQAVALRADLDKALEQFTPETSEEVA